MELYEKEFLTMMKEGVVSEKSEMQSILTQDEPISQKTRKRVEAALEAIKHLEANQNPTLKEIQSARNLVFKAIGANMLRSVQQLSETLDLICGNDVKSNKKSHKLKEIRARYKKLSKYYN